MDERLLESIGFLAALWFVAAVCRHYTEPKRKDKETEYLCGYHLSSINRVNQLAMLDHTRCHLCKEEGVSHV